MAARGEHSSAVGAGRGFADDRVGDFEARPEIEDIGFECRARFIVEHGGVLQDQLAGVSVHDAAAARSLVVADGDVDQRCLSGVIEPTTILTGRVEPDQAVPYRSVATGADARALMRRIERDLTLIDARPESRYV